ncbi:MULTISPECIES: GlsB/YeaQ/YmgE family stress response membrane protein [Larsenimonas]|uniref:GlsB/YeaQ/YmgE family stress response membrane protein n=1 Tax=Larsenimonas suaedae TaxID=1851019 RepID=A0ABU1GUU1_9GAMM|nr:MULTISPECIES: GlsB/YeaQ/YmgE family stress response membrane protein [Larsenimonas]MCM2971062.1 GlsB/YeaQ/YmgE family stress response membrane protein [Larsenimonas suaedae]MCM5703168.1 GlsB/YeaQ/YmgE family stress response membrane protein [Larsenimonas salina]MDR5895771.1 GlsB/YeaQ/YmgE family stress response membrane protein [Larsenimonas suaedae]
MGIILWLIIGGLAGWIAGKIMRGGGFGIVGNIVVGIVGAVIGGALLSVLGLSSSGGIIGSLVTALIGAVVLLWIVSLIKKKA